MKEVVPATFVSSKPAKDNGKLSKNKKKKKRRKNRLQLEEEGKEKDGEEGVKADRETGEPDAEVEYV